MKLKQFLFIANALFFIFEIHNGDFTMAAVSLVGILSVGPI